MREPNVRFRARTLIMLSALRLLTACSGADAPPTSPGTPTPPPGTGVPTTLAVHAGNEQSAFPGIAVAEPPAAVVRDARGQPVAGVTVTFAVVAGGGTLVGATASTNAQGIAAAGGWTPGAAGEQLVEARAGTLPAVRFRATLSTGAVEATIPSAGGQIEITTPSHPYRGLTLAMPGGAFEQPGTWRIALAAEAAPPALPPGFSVTGPALRIDTNQRRAQRLMTLRVPIPRLSGAVRLVVVLDPARSAMEMVPVIAEDATSITVAASHLSASLLLARRSNSASQDGALAALPPGSPQVESPLLVYAVSVTMEALRTAGTTLSGFLNTAWPAADVGSYAFPAGHGPAVALMSVFSQLQNEPVRSVVKVLEPLGVLADTASFASLQIMAARHKASLASQQVLADLSVAMAGATTTLRDSLTAINLWGGLAISQLPQLMVFEERLGAAPGRRAFATMFGNVNGTTQFSAPASPLTPSTLTLGPGGFVSRQIRESVDALVFEAQGVLAAGGSLIYPMEEYANVLPTMMAALRAVGRARDQANRTLAAAANFPTISLEWQGAMAGVWAPVDSTLIIRDSSARVRALCGDCTNALPQGGAPTQQALGVNVGAAGGSFLSLDFAPTVPPGLFNELGLGELTGAIMTRVDPTLALSSLATAMRAALPIRMPMSLSLFRLERDAQRVPLDRPVELRARMELPPSDGYTIDWDFGDGTPIVRTTDALVVSHRYTEAGPHTLRAELRATSTPSAGFLLATARGTIEVDDSELELTPDPLSGEYDDDYVLTATSSTPPPPNASWRWALGDGRVVTTTTNQITVRYSAPSPRVTREFSVRVTLISSGDTIATGVGRVEMGRQRWAAWRITDFSYTLLDDDRNTPSPVRPQEGPIWNRFTTQTGGTDWPNREFLRNQYFADSARFSRIVHGTEPTVLLYVHETMHSPHAPGSTEARIVPPGVFALTEQQFAARDGAVIYGLRSDTVLVGPSIIGARFMQTAEIATSDLAGPRWVNAAPLNCEADYVRRFDVSGDPRIAGSVGGTRWRLFNRASASPTWGELSQVNIVDAVSLQASGETATGTWTQTYRLESNGCGMVIPTRVDLRVVRRGTFTAVRIR